MNNENEPSQPASILKLNELKERKNCRLIGHAREMKFVELENRIVKRSSGAIEHEKGRVVGAELSQTGSQDFYNQSEPMEIGDDEVSAVRADDHGTQNSIVRFCRHKKIEDEWAPISDADDMPWCQDPSSQGVIDGEKYLSVVHTRKNDKNEYDYWAELYKLNPELKDLECVGKSPELCKGLHLIRNNNGSISGFIRRQGEEFSRGKVCYFEINSIDELQSVLDDLDKKAQTIEMFDSEEWGGVNDVQALLDGRIGILGHIARSYIDEKGIEQKEYCVTSAIFDPTTREMSDLKIILTIDDLVDKDDKLLKNQIAPKQEGLDNVIYPTNSVLRGDELDIYIGVKDAKSYVQTVENPWK